jgi:hypothetical protein
MSDTAMDTLDATSSGAERDLPTITFSRMLDLKTSSKRFKMELAISGVRHSNLAGESMPHKAGWQHHPGIMVLGQNVDGREITIEAAGDDMHWLNIHSRNLTLDNTVVLERPTFSSSK